MSVVLCKLPRLGLGNQLFPLMKASVFAEINELKLFVLGYNQFKIGPYLRREKSKRNYQGYFTFQKNVFLEYLERLSFLQFKSTNRITEPGLREVDDAAGKVVYVFQDIPDWSDYFAGLRENRELAIQLFWRTLSDDVKRRVSALASPCIGVHIRKGDFRKLQSEEDFSKVGLVRTPDDFFESTIKDIRKSCGKDLPVSIFTDGYPEELERILSLGNIRIVEGNSDIVDMLLLSKSSIIITSAGSTFSMWSGFLSEAPIIMHPDHIHARIRNQSIENDLFEGPFDPANVALVNYLKSIACEAYV